MKKTVVKIIIAASLLLSVSCKNTSETKVATGQPRFKEDWESLATNEKEPEWFQDAKFGIYFHWGVYSVPAFDNEWYPRWMYVPGRKDWGGTVFEHLPENLWPAVGI